jgi:hypothetical protein
MAILLKDLWPIAKPEDYKVHFARWNGDSQPLEVFVRDRTEWQGLQEYRPARNDFNRQFIFSLAQFYHESDAWLFGGIFRVVTRYEDRYRVKLLDVGSEFIGRLKLHSNYRGRTTRANFEITTTILPFWKYCARLIRVGSFPAMTKSIYPLRNWRRW